MLIFFDVIILALLPLNVRYKIRFAKFSECNVDS